MNECLTAFVEAHDIQGLEALINDDPKLMNLDYPSNFVASDQKNMKEYMEKNKSCVELACELGHLDMLIVLLNNGCSPNLPTSHGRLIHTVLTHLKDKRHLIDNGMALKTIHLMMSLDCDVNIKDYSHKSPLMLAAELAYAPIIHELLPKCLDWQLSGNPQTPLHMVCMQGSVACALALIPRMTTEGLDAIDHKYNTAVMCCLQVLHNHLEYHGIGDDERAERKHLKVQSSHMAIIEHLLEAGAASNMDEDVLEDQELEFEDLCDSPTEPVVSLFLLCSAYEIIKLDLWEDGMPITLKDFESELPGDFCDRKHIFTDETGEGVGKKLMSVYGMILRMMVDAGLQVFGVRTYDEWADSFPFCQGILIEIKEYMEKRGTLEGPAKSPKCLMNLSRKAIRLCCARNDTLGELHKLPIPWKMRGYVMYLML